MTKVNAFNIFLSNVLFLLEILDACIHRDDFFLKQTIHLNVVPVHKNNKTKQPDLGFWATSCWS